MMSHLDDSISTPENLEDDVLKCPLLLVVEWTDGRMDG